MNNINFRLSVTAFYVTIVGFLFLLTSVTKAEELNIPKLADCIYKTEGVNSKYPYGIKIAIPYEKNKYKKYSKQAAYIICCKTIRNNYNKWNSSSKKEDFITALGNTYCPPSCDKAGNTKWIKNVRYFYYHLQSK
jgi:hypothetical protein